MPNSEEGSGKERGRLLYFLWCYSETQTKQFAFFEQQVKNEFLVLFTFFFTTGLGKWHLSECNLKDQRAGDDTGAIFAIFDKTLRPKLAHVCHLVCSRQHSSRSYNLHQLSDRQFRKAKNINFLVKEALPCNTAGVVATTL